MADAPSDKLETTAAPAREEKTIAEHETLKYSLLGPSLTKSGQDNVDQNKASLLPFSTEPRN
jgi:DNA polymerase kappa